MCFSLKNTPNRMLLTDFNSYWAAYHRRYKISRSRWECFHTVIRLESWSAHQNTDMQKFSSNLNEKIKISICAGIEHSTLFTKNFFALILKKIIYLESGQLTYTENNNFLKFLRQKYSVRITGLKVMRFWRIIGAQWGK